MDYVFIDTSVFETNNFIEASAINQLLKLGRNKEIQIIIPEITIREVENRIRTKVNESYTVFKKFRKEARTFRAIPEHQTKFEPINKEGSAAFIIKTLHNELASANAVFIPYPSRNIKKVFDNYFTSSPPFGKADKKNEFPDAFSLMAVEEWCEDKNKVCHILSMDKDMTEYISKYFRTYDNYYDFIDAKLQEIEIKEYNNKRIEKAKQLYKESKEEIESSVERWLYEQLENEDNYDLNIYSEIHDLNLEDLSFKMSDYRFIETSGDNIILESEIAVYYRVTLEVDDESTGYYDSDDRSWHYFDTRSITFENNETIPINFYVETPQAGEDFMSIKIDSINNGYDLEI